MTNQDCIGFFTALFRNRENRNSSRSFANVTYCLPVDNILLKSTLDDFNTSNNHLHCVKQYWRTPGTWFTKYKAYHYSFFIYESPYLFIFSDKIIGYYKINNDYPGNITPDIINSMTPCLYGLSNENKRLVIVNPDIFSTNENDLCNKFKTKIANIVLHYIKHHNEIDNSIGISSEFRFTGEKLYRLASYELSDVQDDLLNELISSHFSDEE